MTEQLALFEPAGAELAELSQAHVKKSAYLEKVAQTLRYRGFEVGAAFYDAQGKAAEAQATICELAFMFEHQAGLV